MATDGYYWEPYDWYWRRKPCPKSGSRQCHWNTLFKEPRGYCWDCVQAAREQFRRAFQEERMKGDDTLKQSEAERGHW